MSTPDHHQVTFAVTRGWREKDAFGGLRDHGDTMRFDAYDTARARRQQLLTWGWADDGFKVGPWVGPITRSEFNVDERGRPQGSADVTTIGGTMRRDDPSTMAEDSRRRAQHARDELARRFTSPKDDL